MVLLSIPSRLHARSKQSSPVVSRTTSPRLMTDTTLILKATVLKVGLNPRHTMTKAKPGNSRAGIWLPKTRTASVILYVALTLPAESRTMVNSTSTSSWTGATTASRLKRSRRHLILYGTIASTCHSAKREVLIWVVSVGIRIGSERSGLQIRAATPQLLRFSSLGLYGRVRSFFRRNIQ